MDSVSAVPGLATTERLASQLEFALELDKLKRTLRQSMISGRSRRENSAEHSWHIATMAILLAEHAPEPVNVTRVVEMLLVHDVVEIDAGDTFCYDDTAGLDKDERERLAARRIFGLLPPDQAARLHALWEEFEEGRTPEARFAAVMDRLQPALLNFENQGGTWREYGVRRDQVLARMQPIRDGCPDLWELVRGVVDAACERGWIAPAQGDG